jgi:hypothetical protein
MSLEAESWARMGLRKEASPIELIINWLTFWGGLEPTKTILIPRRKRKRIGGIRRRVFIFSRGFLSKGVLENHYRGKITPSQSNI